MAGNGVGWGGMGSDGAKNGVEQGREHSRTGGRQTRGWGGVNLDFLYFEVDFCAFITKCHFSVNISPRGLKGQGKFY